MNEEMYEQILAVTREVGKQAQKYHKEVTKTLTKVCEMISWVAVRTLTVNEYNKFLLEFGEDPGDCSGSEGAVSRRDGGGDQ